MEQFIINDTHIVLPPHIISKLKGKNINVLEVEDGILLKILDCDPISSARGSLKGFKFSSKKYREYKNIDKEMEL